MESSTTIEAPFRRDAATAALAAVYLVLATVPFVLAWMPVDEIVARFLYEDFFYYLEVAENVVSGRGVSFDGIAPTNGFHPLWMIVCMLVEALAGPTKSVPVMLSLGALLHVVQAYLIFDILRPHVRRTVAHGAAIFFLADYRAIACNMCGLETPLQVLFFLLFVRALFAHHGALNSSSALRFGLLLGFGIWARFDLLLLLGGALAYFALDPSFGKPFADRVRNSAIVGTVAVVTLVPWFVFSMSQSGTLLPNSEKAIALFAYSPSKTLDLAAPMATIVKVLRHRFFSASHWLADSANLLGLSPSVPPAYENFGGLSIGLLLTVLLLFAWRTRREEIGVRRLAVLLYCIGHLAYYALFYRAEVRYLMPVNVGMLLIAAMMVDWVVRPGRTCLKWLVMAGYVALLINVTIAGWAAWQKGWGATRTHALHAHLRDMGKWLGDSVAPDTRIGAFNAGTLSHFSERKVTNLDGVINDHAFEALAKRELLAYIDSEGITVLTDLESQINDFMNKFSGRDRWRDGFREIARLGPVVALERTHELDATE